MRCLYCGKRLTILRKLTDSEFCTDSHRRQYQQEHEQMALAHLMDAQKRFSGFTGQGMGESTPKSGKSKAKPSAAETPQEQMPQEVVKSFLPYFPAARPLERFVRIPAAPLVQMVDCFLPEYRFIWTASPAIAGETPITACSPKPLGRDFHPVDPGSLLSEAPATGSLSMERQPFFRLRAVLWNSPSLAIGGECGWSWAQPREEAVPVRKVSPLEPAFAAVEVVRPAIALDALSGLAASPLTAPLQPDLSLSPAPVALGLDAEPAGFINTVLTAPLSRLLKPVETLPALPLFEEAVEDYSDAPAPLARKLFTLPKPGFVERKGNHRRVRPRELFFPLPRLGDLPSLASRVASENIRYTLYRGVDCEAWTPEALERPFSLAFVDDPKGRGASAFPEVSPTTSNLQCIPPFPGSITALAGMGEAVRLEGADALSPLVGSVSILQTSGSLVLEELSVSAPSTPRLPAAFEQPVLGMRLSLEAYSGLAAAGHNKPHSRGVAACDAKPAEFIERPAFHAATAPSSANLELSPCYQMTGLVPAAGRQSAPERMPAAAEWAVSAGGEIIQRRVPSSSIREEFHPALANQIYALAHCEASPYPSNTVAFQDLSPLWPDPVRTMPSLRGEIAEDSGVREAVRAINVVLAQQKHAWMPKFGMPSIQFARADLKWFVMSVPVLLLLAIYSLTNHDSSPGPMAALQPESGTQAAVEPAPIPEAADAKSANAVVPGQPAAPVSTLPAEPAGPPSMMENVKQSIMRRAAVSLSDDFRAGLGEWEGEGKWSSQWSYDRSGFINTGPLAYFRPSMQLTDYRMEFLGQIEKKSLGWVFRGKDFDNYYAMKIVMTKPGPLPNAAIEHYVVINGKESGLHRRPLPIQIRTDTLYRVRMDVRGSEFTLSVQGQVVDYWSDERLKSGGIGFFSAKGEQARLRWIEVSHQYDFLGRLCAFLAPYSLPVKDGSLKQ